MYAGDYYTYKPLNTSISKMKLVFNRRRQLATYYGSAGLKTAAATEARATVVSILRVACPAPTSLGRNDGIGHSS